MSLASQVLAGFQAVGTRVKAVETSLAQKQPIDADLTSIAGLASAAGKMLRATAAQTWALIDVTDFATTVLDDANATTMRATLNVPSVGEAQGYGVQTGIMGSAKVTASSTTIPATATTVGGTAGYISGATVTITGEGRPVNVRAQLPSVKRGTATQTYSYLFLNMNDVLQTYIPVKGLGTTDPGDPGWIEFTTGTLTSGVSYRFNLGLTSPAGTGTMIAVAAATVPIELMVARG